MPSWHPFLVSLSNDGLGLAGTGMHTVNLTRVNFQWLRRNVTGKMDGAEGSKHGEFSNSAFYLGNNDLQILCNVESLKLDILSGMGVKLEWELSSLFL